MILDLNTYFKLEGEFKIRKDPLGFFFLSFENSWEKATNKLTDLPFYSDIKYLKINELDYTFKRVNCFRDLYYIELELLWKMKIFESFQELCEKQVANLFNPKGCCIDDQGYLKTNLRNNGNFYFEFYEVNLFENEIVNVAGLEYIVKIVFGLVVLELI